MRDSTADLAHYLPTALLDGIEARFGRSAGLSGLFLPAKQPRC